MDAFGLFLDGLCLTGQSVLHIAFISRLSGAPPAVRHIALYLVLLVLIEACALRLALPAPAALCAQILALYAVGRAALRRPRPVSLASAVLAVYLSQLSFGLLNPIEAVLLPPLAGTPRLYPALLLAALAALGLCALCVRAARRVLALADEAQTPAACLLLCPGAFFLAAELYLLHTAYRAPASAVPPPEPHALLFLLQALGLASFFSTLFICRHIGRHIAAHAALAALAQAADAQKTYVAEAQTRLRQTAALRHDLRRHLCVLDGLLQNARYEESKRYLKTLCAASAALSPPYHTGSPVVDILLAEKLALAKADGVETGVALRLPDERAVDGFDLCVIFANALDNALRACRGAAGTPFIRVFGKRRGGVYLLTFENACADGPPAPFGIGLANIRAAAEKYGGTIEIEKSGGRFALYVLLLLPAAKKV